MPDDPYAPPKAALDGDDLALPSARSRLLLRCCAAPVALMAAAAVAQGVSSPGEHWAVGSVGVAGVVVALGLLFRQRWAWLAAMLGGSSLLTVGVSAALFGRLRFGSGGVAVVVLVVSLAALWLGRRGVDAPLDERRSAAFYWRAALLLSVLEALAVVGAAVLGRHLRPLESGAAAADVGIRVESAARSAFYALAYGAAAWGLVNKTLSGWYVAVAVHAVLAVTGALALVTLELPMLALGVGLSLNVVVVLYAARSTLGTR